jgi:hypothetical protein
MAMRVTLGKSVAAGAAALPSIRFRTSKPPYLFQTSGGFTGNVNVEHSVDSFEIADSAATWSVIATLGSNDTASWASPLHRARMAGGPTTGTASLYVVERADHS